MKFPEIRMKRSDALTWVKRGILNGQYHVAVDVLNQLIEQEKKYEEQEDEKGENNG